ncbi:HK97 gp10 family phage protein [Erysipelothrix sp. D19-032]
MSIKGSDSLLRKLSALDDIALDGAQSGLTKSPLKVQRDAKRHAPRNSSDLANSIHTRVDKGEKSISGSVYTNNPHAMYVEFGTGPKGKGTKKNHT